MTAVAPPDAGASADGVVLAWEPRGDEDDQARLAALRSLGGLAQMLGAPVLLAVDATTERLLPQLLQVLQAGRVTVVPVVVVGAPGMQMPFAAAMPYAAATDAGAVLRALDGAGVIAQWPGVRYAGIVAEQNIEAAAAGLVSALSAPSLEVRLGFVNVRSPHIPIPNGMHFAFDWQPYRVAEPTGKLVPNDYGFIATEIARRHSGTGPLAPSVVCAASGEIDLPQAGIQITGVSPIKVVYAIESARRFVRNRAGPGVPFWVLRIQADSGADLSPIAALLGDGHAISGRGARAPIAMPESSAARIAVVIHLYYPELWPELRDAISAIPERFDLFVSSALRARDAVEKMVRGAFPGATVFGTRNLGRDVLPFLHWLETPGASRYEYVLKLHSKKSVHIIDPTTFTEGGGEEWRRRALGGLIGGPAAATGVLAALDRRPDVGIVAPAGLLYDQVTWRCATGDHLPTLRDRLGIPGELTGRFPAGTMFWARTAALAPLARLPDAALDFEFEAGQTDGTLHHAYERLFPIVAAAQGYRTIESSELT